MLRDKVVGRLRHQLAAVTAERDALRREVDSLRESRALAMSGLSSGYATRQEDR